MTFDKPMNPDTFHEGLTFTPLDPSKNYHLSFACAPNDCKTIILTHGASFDYTGVYTFTLLTGSTGIKDTDGNTLVSPSSWKFTVRNFKADRDFVNLTIDGGGIPVKNEGECTTVAVDKGGKIHLAYLSVFDNAVKHASCDPNTKNCSLLVNWEIEIIDQGTTSHGLGRDENMVIDQAGFLHVSYRDYGGTPLSGGLNSDQVNVLKYATNKFGKDPVTGYWKSVIVDDTTAGVTDTFIKVSDDDRVHITYHGKNEGESGLYYASCSQNCLTPASSSGSPWNVIPVDTDGNNHGQPNFLFVTENPLIPAVHISYYADGVLKYAFCPLTNGDGSCDENGKEAFLAVVDSSAADVGTENSLFVNSQGVHITYRSVNSAGEESLKYAFCASPCTKDSIWNTITVDASVGAGRSTQIKIDSGNHIHVVYGDSVNGDLKYAFCATDCLTPSQWSLNVIDAPGVVGHDNYLALGPDEKTVYLSYRDHGNEGLKIAFGPSPFSH
jgi:hypothetical protein